MPAYFWMYNLYALERNSWKTGARDRRKTKIQHIEKDYLAPDTAEEILAALDLLEGWLGEAGYSPADIAITSHSFDTSVIPCNGLEKSKRAQVIIKPLKAIAAYRQMLRWYAAKTIADFIDTNTVRDFTELKALLNGEPGNRIQDWVNMGGQIVPAFRVDQLRQDINAGNYTSWEEIHRCYDTWHEQYPLDKARHAWALFVRQEGFTVNAAALVKELKAAADTRRWINRQIFELKAKDLRDPFSRMTFRNAAEMEQVLGKAEDDSFVNISRQETQRFEECVARVIERLKSADDRV